jgi:hypothetical protein
MRVGGVLRAELALLRSQVLTSGRGGVRWRGGAGALLLGVLLAAVLTWTFRLTFRGLAEAGVDTAGATVVFAWVVQLAFLAMLVLDLQLAVSELVVGRELELLRRTPLAPAEVLALTLLRGLPQTAGLLVVAVGAAWWGLVRAYPELAPLTPRVAPALTGLWLCGLGAGVAAALALLRVVPGTLLRETLGMLATLVVTLAWLANSFLLPRLGGEGRLDAMLEGSLTTLRPPPGWSPARWAADAMTGPDPATAFAALAVAAAAAAALALCTAHAWLDHAQSAARVGARRRGVAGPVRRAPTRLAAFLTRDLALVTRDWTVLGDILTGAVLWMLLPLIIAPTLEMAPAGLARSMLVMLATGLGYEVAARALPLERRSLAWAALSPVGVGGWVACRIAGVVALTLPLMAGAAIAVILGLGLDARGAGHAALLALGAWALAMGTGLLTGARAGDPDWVHPRAMLGFGGRLAASVLALAQAGAWSAAGWAVEGGGLGSEMALAGAGVVLGLLAMWTTTSSVEQNLVR